MARHQIRAAKPKPEAPRATIGPAPSSYETTHPVGSAERFLDQAAKDALAAAAAGGVPPLSRFVPGAVRAVAKEAEKYPDPLLSEAAGLPAAELAKRAARAEAYRQAMKAQNDAVQAAAAAMSPVGNMVVNQTGATVHDVATRQSTKGGRTVRAAEGAGSTDEKSLSISSFADKDTYKKWSAQQTGAQNGDVRYVQIGNNYFKQTYRQGTSEATSGWNGQVMQKSEWDAIQGRPSTSQPTTPQPTTPQPTTPQPTTPQPIKSLKFALSNGRTEVAQRSHYEEMKRWAENPGLLWKTGEKVFDPINKLFGKTTFAQSRKESGERAQHMLNIFGNADLVVNNPKGVVSEDIGVDYRDTGGSLWVANPWNPKSPKQHLRIIGVNQDAKGGRTVHTAQGAQDSAPPVDAEVPAEPSSGPRIVINPTTFRNNKDALCVAFNEGFRVWMEANDFQPQSEPTDAQRKFFSDTAYADDEVQLRRTILARIATFDTSVKDPTDDQLSETASFLNAVLESDWCRNDWERNSVAKLAKAVEASVGAEPVEPKAEPLEAREEAPLEARAALGGGETDEERKRQELAQADDQSNGQDLETESGSGAAVHYNEDGSFAGQDNADGSYSTVSEGSGEVVQYGADGSYLGAVTKEGEQKSPLATEPPQTAGEEAPAAGDQAAQERPGEQQQEKPGEQQQEKPGEQQQEEEKPDRGAYADIWTGGEEGKGRRLTRREAEWTRARIDSGASVSDSQLALFGLSRNEQGQYVNGGGEVHQGFDTQPAAQAANPDAGLDRDRKGRGGRRLGDFGARSLTNTKRMT